MQSALSAWEWSGAVAKTGCDVQVPTHSYNHADASPGLPLGGWFALVAAAHWFPNRMTQMLHKASDECAAPALPARCDQLKYSYGALRCAAGLLVDSYRADSVAALLVRWTGINFLWNHCVHSPFAHMCSLRLVFPLECGLAFFWLEMHAWKKFIFYDVSSNFF